MRRPSAATEARAPRARSGGLAVAGDAATPAGSPEGLMELMLEACGERGYRDVCMRGLAGPDGGPAADGWFEDEADCFAGAYASEAERLRRLLARAGRAGGRRREAIEAVLVELARLIEERPAVARSLLAEVHVAGGRALEERRRLLADLARTIDEIYRLERLVPPPLGGAALFMVEAVEAVAQRASVTEDPTLLVAAIPDLARMLDELYGLA